MPSVIIVGRGGVNVPNTVLSQSYPSSYIIIQMVIRKGFRMSMLSTTSFHLGSTFHILPDTKDALLAMPDLEGERNDGQGSDQMSHQKVSHGVSGVDVCGSRGAAAGETF
jgi:hypothetical protein